MREIVVLGCGYVGLRLVKRLVARGDKVRATTTTEAKLDELAKIGAARFLLRTDDPATFAPALKNASAVVHLAPPGDAPIQSQAEALVNACGAGLRSYLYGSTTGAFGQPNDPNQWIDETTPSRAARGRGQKRLDFERALRATGAPLRIVRIAGIYGPGRTLLRSIQRNRLVLFEGGPPTSRIHVDDLVRLLEAMLEDRAPPLAIACDDRPAETLEVARYTCGLVGAEAPAPLAIEEARKVMSDAAIEMRMSGRRCRSLVRDRLIGALTYPTYREGVRASLIEEGQL